MIDRIKEAIREHESAACELAGQAELIAGMAGMLIECVRQGHRIFVLGNGGSAADAQHIAAELVGRFRRDRRALPAMALTTDTSLLTAVSNDYGYERVFERQIEAHVGAGDVVWAISTSGKSPNVLLAVRKAKERGAAVIAFTGGTGGELPGLADACLIAAADTSDRIQEMHQLAYHVICELVESELCA